VVAIAIFDSRIGLRAAPHIAPFAGLFWSAGACALSRALNEIIVAITAGCDLWLWAAGRFLTCFATSAHVETALCEDLRGNRAGCGRAIRATGSSWRNGCLRRSAQGECQRLIGPVKYLPDINFRDRVLGLVAAGWHPARNLEHALSTLESIGGGNPAHSSSSPSWCWISNLRLHPGKGAIMPVSTDAKGPRSGSYANRNQKRSRVGRLSRRPSPSSCGAGSGFRSTPPGSSSGTRRAIRADIGGRPPCRRAGYMDKLRGPLLDTLNMATTGTVLALFMGCRWHFWQSQHTERVFCQVPWNCSSLFATPRCNSLTLGGCWLAHHRSGVFCRADGDCLRSIGFCAAAFEAIVEMTRNRSRRSLRPAASRWPGDGFTGYRAESCPLRRLKRLPLGLNIANHRARPGLARRHRTASAILAQHAGLAPGDADS